MTGPSRRSAFLAVLLANTGCDGKPNPETKAPERAWFTDVTRDLGFAFRHENGASGRKYFVETNGSGAAWLDYDGDGDLDAYLVQGAALPGFTPPSGSSGPLRNVLLRQDRTPTSVRFVDATEAAKVGGSGAHGMAAAAADYDGDGDQDLFVTNFGPNVLYRNEGDGTFRDVTAAARVAGGERYHSSCAFGDFDRDGDLDLYVVGYVDFRLDDGKTCGDLTKGEAYRSYCHPDIYDGIDDALYRNDGDGTFTDVSQQAGLAGKKGKGLGVCTADFDRDGDLDLFVANDSDPNFLWRNDGGLEFTNVAPLYGVDFNGEGRTQACMGAAFGDVENDGDFDLFTVNLSNEYNTLWLLEGAQLDAYRDRSYASGLAAPSLPDVGFGTVMADFDNDRDLDVVVANGHVLDNADLTLTGTTYRQRAGLYPNDGSGRFRRAPPAEAGTYFDEPHVGRGLAAADFDDDGDLDLLFTNNHEEAHLLRNDVGSERSWIGFDLTGKGSNRDALGAEVCVRTRSATLLRTVRAAESYLSSHDLRIIVGLGEDPGPVDVEVRWPSGRAQDFPGLDARRYHALEEQP